MKPGKKIITLEIKTDIPLRLFTKSALQALFDNFEPDFEELNIDQVKKQAVREDR